MPGNIEVLTTRIVSFVYMGNDSGIRNATTLAVSLMILANGLLFFMTWFMGRKDYTTIGGKSTRPALVELGKWKGLATFLVAVYAFIAVILPLGSIVITSFMVSMSKGLVLIILALTHGYRFLKTVSISIAFGALWVCFHCCNDWHDPFPFVLIYRLKRT